MKIQRLACIMGLSLMSAEAFAPASQSCQTSAYRNSRVWSSNREEEIARLEEQLRQLKEDENQSTDVPEEPSTPVNGNGGAQGGGASLSSIREVSQGRSVILSERELAGLTGSEENGVTMSLPGPIVAIAAVVFLVIFSQIPIGQEDLSKYSASGSAAVQTIDLGDLNTDIMVDPSRKTVVAPEVKPMAPTDASSASEEPSDV